MHPYLQLETHKQQVNERVAESARRRLVTQIVRNRTPAQHLEHHLSTLVYRLGLWLRVNLALQCA
ncbi:MAG: hypothetical protein ABI413_03680 [Ktedonobacteraceae bacterium]